MSDMTAKQALEKAAEKVVQCRVCLTAQTIGDDEVGALLEAVPTLGYRGVSRAFGLMGHKVRPDSIKIHIENGHP